MSAPGVAVLELVREQREKAAVVEEFNPTEAAFIRRIADQYEEAVKLSMPEWWTLAAVQAAKPWSMKALRRRARRLQSEGRARKNPGNGHWEIRWDAVMEMNDPPVRLEEVDPDDEAMLDELAGL